VGVDGKGSSDSREAGKHGNVVAICDIDERRLAKGAATFPDAKKFTDYREMYNEMGDKIDAVTVSTPDHSHAPASVAAMKLGKHCFCQKPLTWSVKEAHVVRALAAEKGVATQMGNQGTANTGLREGVEIVRAGLLGDIKSVHVWTNRPIWPQGEGRPADAQPIPKGLHWDLFLGPAKERPYNGAYHPFKWRGWIDFGTGALGDMACHTSNMVVMALDLFDPTSISATSSGINSETYPKNSKITFQFPERPRGDGDGKWSAIPMHWYDGGNLPPQELVPGVKFRGSGSMIVGTKATLYSPNDYGAQFSIYKPGTSDKVKDFKKPEASLPRSPGHFTEYAIACAGGPAAMSNFNYAARLTGTILLGNVALRAGKEVKWDAEKMTTGDRETDKLLHRDYREGWTL
jgi:predicted dehydrogenase